MKRGVDRNVIAWTLNPRSSVRHRDLPPAFDFGIMAENDVNPQVSFILINFGVLEYWSAGVMD
jgi:hypothetical protein